MDGIEPSTIGPGVDNELIHEDIKSDLTQSVVTEHSKLFKAS